MTPQELKNSLLQLAIQGRLVPQRPEEGTADELYRQIQREKAALVKAGKIKKEKPLPEITEEEVPFEIPEGWKWVRIADITELNPKNDLEDDLDTAFIPMTCVSDGFRNTHTFEIKKWGEIKKGFTHFADGDIGIAKITPCFQNRKSVIFRDLAHGYGAGTTELSIVRTFNNTIAKEYMLWFFKSEHFISNGVKSFTGTAGQQRIHKDYLRLCLFPLPPLAEQKRIVAKIEELLPYIDRYEVAWSRLEDFNKRFPTDMQKSILQLAIQGKLVPQRPEEGTGEALYQQIQAEKQTLIRSGQLKKEKPLPEIIPDEIPFDIPESWKWTKLGNITDKLTDGSHNPPPNTGVGYPVISAKNIRNGQVMLNNVDRYTDEKGFNKENPRTSISFGDIIMGIIGGSIGNIGLYLHKDKVIAQRSIAIIHSIVDSRFLVAVLRCPFIQNYMHAVAAGSAQGGVYLGTLGNLPIPLPPLAEQKRIVAKLEELLPLCERLN